MNYDTRIAFLFVALLALTSGATAAEPVKSGKSASCHIVFDAGSSGTRLFVYEKKGGDWPEHPGPTVGALADPIREIRGKKNADIDAVTTEVVATLDRIQKDGPLDKKGKNEWQAFDWSSRCHVVSTMVYATAGMRIAEQEGREKSIELWKNLKQKLQTRVGGAVEVTTRTLTGYEEGLYAWLAVREQKKRGTAGVSLWEQKKRNTFGIAEMGGASTQVAFPCSKCDGSDDAIKTIMIDGSPLRIYSYSFSRPGTRRGFQNFRHPA